MNPYKILTPQLPLSPIILSIPHCGTDFPADLMNEYKSDLLPPDDTDWFVDQLYSFASEIGTTIISSKYSRWVIDLNRNPDNQPLYNDGRVITELCPATDFLGNPIYKDERKKVDAEEVQRRKTLYFDPYHLKIQELLDQTKKQFGGVLLWDCHSIRRNVPSINKDPFPDLILGSADGTSASNRLIEEAYTTLSSGRFGVNQNHPFKGGFITRHFGLPAQQQHALQLEMSKDLYMDDSETVYDESRAKEVQDLLKQTLLNLHSLLLNL